MNLGLAVRSVRVHKGERRSEIFFVVYFGSDASVQDGNPLTAVSRTIEGVVRDEVFEFDGLGLLLVPPTEVRGGLISWHVELWESDQKHRDLGGKLVEVTAGIDFGSPVVIALTGAGAGAATKAVGKIAEKVGNLLEGRGDQLLVTWAGSLFTDQLDMLAGAAIVKETKMARVEYRVIVTSGEPPMDLAE